VAELQKEVDGKLAQVLTDEQKNQLKDMREAFGRGGRGGRSRGGFGPVGFGGGRPPDVVYRWQVYCLDRSTGKVLWKQLALEGNMRAGASGDVTLKKGETSNAGVAWSQARGAPEEASPLVYQGYVYILRKNGGLITCYDARTGKQIYRERIPGAKGFWASPWAQGGKLFCLDDEGTTHVLQAGPNFKVLGKNNLKDMFWASPAVVGGAVILRGVDHLYCVAEAQ
jgi:outer membrane protein assembly factor BamB